MRAAGRSRHPAMLGDHAEEMRCGDDHQEGNDEDRNDALENMLRLREATRHRLHPHSGSIGNAAMPGFQTVEINTQPSIGRGCPPHVHHRFSLVPRMIRCAARPNLP